MRLATTVIFFLAGVLATVPAAAQDGGDSGSFAGPLFGPRESCRQTHTFDAPKSTVWEALTYAWDDLGLPSLPDQPGDIQDEDAGRIHASLHPGVSGYSWGPEMTCCDILVVDASVMAEGGRTRVDLRLTAGYSVSECCDLDMPGYELEQVFFDAIQKRLPVPYPSDGPGGSDDTGEEPDPDS